MQYSLCEPKCRSVLRIEGPPKHEGKGTLPWPSYEAGPRILPTYPETLSRKAKKHLESLGVEVFTNARVMSVDSDGILVDEQRVPTGTVLWGAGVVASPGGRWLGAETDKSVEISRHAFAYVFGGSGKSAMPQRHWQRRPISSSGRIQLPRLKPTTDRSSSLIAAMKSRSRQERTE